MTNAGTNITLTFAEAIRKDTGNTNFFRPSNLPQGSIYVATSDGCCD